MGKLTLLAVLGLTIATALITFGARQIALETRSGLSDDEKSTLARQVAASGHDAVLAAMMQPEGFAPDVEMHNVSYKGGIYNSDYSVSSDRMDSEFLVTGTYGEAVHSIRGRYRFDPLDYPGPIWMDVPYATLDPDPWAVVSDDEDLGLPVVFETSRYEDQDIASVINFDTFEEALRDALNSIDASLETGNLRPLLEDLNVSRADELYERGLERMTDTDRVIETGDDGEAEVNSRQRWGADGGSITYVPGNLRVTDSGDLEGTGMLIVGGDLEVAESGRLNWSGLVMVRAEKAYLPIRLLGDVSITGGLIISQEAFPPGGHVDVTTFRDYSGEWAQPWGDLTGSRWTVPGEYSLPFYEHTHRFDQDSPGERILRFKQIPDDGSTMYPQEDHLRFKEALEALGDEVIRMEFVNTRKHGSSIFNLAIDGKGEERQTVQQGFGSLGARRYKSVWFRASDLKEFTMEVKTLRTLRPLFDANGGCESLWPVCVGQAGHGRKGTFVVRLRKRSNRKIMYEAAAYWHMKEDEMDEHRAQEEAFRESIRNGENFGTRLELGRQVNLTYSRKPVTALTEKLGFDGPELVHLGTTTEHLSPAQFRAQENAEHGEPDETPDNTPDETPDNTPDETPDNTPGETPDNSPEWTPDNSPEWTPDNSPEETTTEDEGFALVCHNGSTIRVGVAAVPAHIAHGDTLGSCPDTGD